MSFIALHRYPFLRLLLPWAVGVYVGDELFFRGIAIPSEGVWVVAFSLFALLFASYFLKRYSFRWLFGLLLTLLCLAGGAGWMNFQLQQSRVEYPKEAVVYRAVIQEKPEQKERSVLCRVFLAERYDSLVKEVPLAGNALLYLAKDSLSELLQSGDELLLSSRISLPVNQGNPDEFDYSRYLTRKGVSGTGFVSAEEWQKLSRKAPPSLRQQALAWRDRILVLYRKLGFQEDAFAVLSALTVGYKEELSEEIRETYSVSGASHILALSGMHIGLLYGLLFFCLKGLPDRWKGVRLLRAGVILVLLWGFAFFTGLSPSVVRSVIMCSLFSLSGAFGRESFSMNTLSIAAFFMLMVQPAWLFDVGFQLSFCAVTAILLVQPRLYGLLPVKNRVGKYVWGLMSVSLAAQVGTAPLVLLYFSRFSTHFLLTNLLVFPLVLCIMYAAVLMLVLTPLPWMQSAIAILLKGMLEALNASVRWVEQLPWASFDHIWIYPLEAFMLYLALLWALRHGVSRSAKSLLACLLCFLFLCTFHVVMLMNDRPRESLVFYNVRECPAVHCIAANGDSWLVYADTLPKEKHLKRVASRHWEHLRLAEPHRVTADGEENSFRFRNRILSFGGRRVCMVCDNRWQNKAASRLMPVDYLYLCKGYDGRLKELTDLFSFQTVILDASLTDHHRKAFEQECRELGIHFISLAEKGSVRFLL